MNLRYLNRLGKISQPYWILAKVIVLVLFSLTFLYLEQCRQILFERKPAAQSDALDSETAIGEA